MAKKKSKRYRKFKDRLRLAEASQGRAITIPEEYGADKYMPRFSKKNQIKTGIYERGY